MEQIFIEYRILSESNQIQYSSCDMYHNVTPRFQCSQALMISKDVCACVKDASMCMRMGGLLLEN